MFNLGLLLPLIGTTIGSLFVFSLKDKFSNKLNDLLIGFAIGVMLSSSIFSLLIPSIELSKNAIMPTIGFILGFIFLILINKLTSKYNYSKKIDKLLLGVTIHNIPEGMAVGVAFASVLSNKMLLLEALVLSLGIAIQNIPEGSIISFPLRIKGYSKFKSFYYGFLSGIVEPIFSIITLFLISYVTVYLPLFLSFASGCMIFVIFDELTYEIKEKDYGIIGILFGFVIMMILDITLG